MKITNRELREVHTGLTVLANRTLPSISSDLKIAKLLRAHIVGPHRDTEAAREGIVRRHPTPEGWEDESKPPAHIGEARANDFNDFLNSEVDLGEIPDALKVVEADLPKAMKGEKGEENRQGVAQIVALLGPFYLEPTA